MKIAFRVDASEEIGTGHFYRCITLALELKKAASKIHFVVRNLPASFQALLVGYQFSYSNLDTPADAISDTDLPHASWLGVTQLEDAEQTISAISFADWDWVIVDHYALDFRWETQLRRVCQKTLVIDDLADRNHECDLLIDQNLYPDGENPYYSRVSNKCRVLIGPRFSLLRDEFRESRKAAVSRSGRVSNLLIFFGGIDVNNITETAIKAVIELVGHSVSVDVVIGGTNPNRNNIQSLCSQYGYTTHVQTNHIAKLILKADLAVCAGGTSIWERCCLGLPTLTVATAENQKRQVQAAACTGLLVAPDLHGELLDGLRRHLQVLVENSALRSFLSRSGMRMVDARGVLRVVALMGSGGIRTRRAVLSDSDFVFECRNAPSVRQCSRNSEPISSENHAAWFSASLVSIHRIILIGENNSRSVGVVRFDISNVDAEVSIILSDNQYSEGLGQNLLSAAETWLSNNRPDISVLRACVLRDNARSHHLFLAANYKLDSSTYSKRL